MKRVGIVGGLGPESTVQYYRGIIERWRARTGEDCYPEILINSVDMTGMLALIASGDLDALTELLLGAIRDLERAGADFAAIASNTPHLVFDRLRARSPLPLLSIVEATCAEASRLGLSGVLLTGTLSTMSSTFYAEGFSARGIACSAPDEADRRIIQDIIFPELEAGIVVPEKKRAFIELANWLVAARGLDGLVLGCTELPLLVGQADFAFPVLDTSAIHVGAIVDELLR